LITLWAFKNRKFVWKLYGSSLYGRLHTSSSSTPTDISIPAWSVKFLKL
jgi:hypothetical protein